MTTLESILKKSSKPSSTSVLFVLAWIAASDESIDRQELLDIQNIAKANENSDIIPALIELAQSPQVHDLQHVSESLLEFSEDQCHLVLQLAIGIALSDGVLTSGESHIIRFLADLFHITPRGLDAIFSQLTNCNFPPPADLSSRDWWHKQQAQTNARTNADRNNREEEQKEERDYSNAADSSAFPERLRHLALLGLDEHANADDIKQAYRRLAMVHHPDKYTSLGTEAVKAAEISFRRIQAAYDQLRSI